MLNIIKVTGDIFDQKADVICNPVNCIGSMGGGLAKEFAKRYPGMYEHYRWRCFRKQVDIGTGDYYLLVEEPWKVIASVPTMYYPGSKANLEDIALSIGDLIEYMYKNKLKTCVMPYLGCGIGEIDPNDFETFLEKFTSSRDITVILVKYKPKHL